VTWVIRQGVSSKRLTSGNTPKINLARKLGLERAVATAGGQEAFDAAVTAMLDDARGWRLAEMRKRRKMTQEQVAVRMGVSVARVSQIESGDVSTQDVLNRYIAALGGTLKLIADFGDEQLKIA
jgi:DNA-binding XRE family transcriptional regulator